MKTKSQINLFTYIARRVLLAIPTIFGVITIAFIISRALPGDVVLMRIPFQSIGRMYEIERQKLGLDQPLFIQYIKFIQLMLTGDWGYSITLFRDLPILHLLRERLPRTLELIFISMFIATYIGLKIGKKTASNRNKFHDVMSRVIIYLIMAIPGYLIAMSILYYFSATNIKLFPFWGYKSPGIGDPLTITYSRVIDSILCFRFDILIDYLYHLFVPIIALVIIQLVIITRHTRSSMLEILQQDYIRTAISKGVSKKTMLKKHALRNAIPPVITKITLGFTTLLGVMIPIEVALDIKGIGQWFSRAIFLKDYSLVIALVYVYGMIAIIFSLIADIAYSIVDPRIRYK